MLQLERLNDREESMRVILENLSKAIRCAMPGIVHSYNSVQGTCVIQLAIESRTLDADGDVTFEPIALLNDVPVNYMGGGQFVTTYPIQPGDEALVIFSDRCIDSWWQSGGVQIPADLRMHDISDGFAIIGPRSLAKSIPNVSTTTAQFRSLDGSTFFEIASGQVANVVAPNGVNITGPVNINGNVTVTGAVMATQEITAKSSVALSTHLHGGVTSGGSNTGAPIP
jgi:Phage protein Gp138 N-terminal domain/GpV Apex motif